jgi:hypothetical protein
MTAWSCQHPSLAGERCVLEPRAIVTGTFRRENVPKTADTQMAFRSLFSESVYGKAAHFGALKTLPRIVWRSPLDDEIQ